MNTRKPLQRARSFKKKINRMSIAHSLQRRVQKTLDLMAMSPELIAKLPMDSFPVYQIYERHMTAVFYAHAAERHHDAAVLHRVADCAAHEVYRILCSANGEAS